MRILAIETSDIAGSVAVLEAERCIANRPLEPTQRSGQSLAPAIVELLGHVGWQPKSVELVAVATGPGSFTGLRVGVTTAKMFAYAVGAAVVGVNTLEAIARQAPAEAADLWAVLDAQRNQLFAGRFRNDDNGIWQPQTETLLLDNSDWLADLQPGTAVSGPGLLKLREQIPPEVKVVEASLWSPQAETVGQLGWHAFQSGRRDDAMTLVPHYFRPSAAEEKRRR